MKSHINRHFFTQMTCISAVLILTLILMIPVPVEAAQSGAAKKRNAAYKHKVESLREANEYAYIQYATFKMKSVKTPVLGVSIRFTSDMAQTNFYTYRKGKVKRIGSVDGYSAGFKRYGKYIMHSSGHTSLGWTVTVLKYKGNKLKRVYHKDYYNEESFNMNKIKKEMESAACKKLKLKCSSFKSPKLR